VPWEDLAGVTPDRFTVRTAVGALDGRDLWTELMPPVQSLSDELIAEGNAIPVARVQAMHAGKRRAREQRRADEA
jgi:bifunctional non-homologous end joining protein LigD